MYSTSTEEFDLRNQDAVLSVAREMHANGLKNAVFGMFFRDDCQASGELRKMGYLVSKYDNYTDLLPGEVAPLGARVASAFGEGLHSFGDGLGNLAVWLAYHAVGVTALLAVLMGAGLAVRRRLRKRGAVHAPPDAQTEETEGR